MNLHSLPCLQKRKRLETKLEIMSSYTIKIKDLLRNIHKGKTKMIYLYKELLEAGKVKPVIDITFKMSEVEEAFKYFEQGHVQGNLFITI